MTTGRVSKRHRKCVDDDVVVGDVVAVVGVGDGVNPMRNGTRKSHKKFQLSKLRIVDRRSRLVEGSDKSIPVDLKLSVVVVVDPK